MWKIDEKQDKKIGLKIHDGIRPIEVMTSKNVLATKIHLTTVISRANFSPAFAL